MASSAVGTELKRMTSPGGQNMCLAAKQRWTGLCTNRMLAQYVARLVRNDSTQVSCVAACSMSVTAELLVLMVETTLDRYDNGAAGAVVVSNVCRGERTSVGRVEEKLLVLSIVCSQGWRWCRRMGRRDKRSRQTVVIPVLPHVAPKW